MLNLLSKRFSDLRSNSYVDLKLDVEAPRETQMTGGPPNNANLDHFFEEVKKFQGEMEKVRNLLTSLQEANEETRTITSAAAMKTLRDQMDSIIREILRGAKLLKANLEELDRANIANRSIPGCEQGTSTDRTRIAVTNRLRGTLRDLTQDFQTLRQTMVAEYKQTIGRRYYTITGHTADEETLNRMIETGESEKFLQKAVQEQGRGNMLEAIKEIQERHDAAKDVQKSLVDLQQIFTEMSVLVEAQGEQLNDIQASVLHASSFVKAGTENLGVARQHQKNTRKWICIAIIILIIIILVVLVPILIKYLPSSSSSSSTGG